MFAAPEISTSIGHASDTMKSILNHESIRSIKKPDSDISTFDFSSNAGIARQIWKAGTLLRHGWADVSLSARSSFATSCTTGTPKTLPAESGIVYPAFLSLRTQL